MNNRLIMPAHSPSSDVLQAAVTAAADSGKLAPIKKITTPMMIATLPTVEVIANREYPIVDSNTPPDAPLPAIPNIKATLIKGTTESRNTDSVWARTLQAAALLRPSFTYLLIPIAARESGYYPRAANPSSSATGLLQLLKANGFTQWKEYEANPSLQTKLKPVVKTLPPSPLFSNKSQWRNLVLEYPYFQVIPNAMLYEDMIKEVVDKKLVVRSRDQNIFNLPAHLINPVLNAHPFLRSNYKAALQFVSSLWWIEGGPTLRTGPWTHISHALKDVDSLLKFNNMNK